MLSIKGTLLRTTPRPVISSARTTASRQKSTSTINPFLLFHGAHGAPLGLDTQPADMTTFDATFSYVTIVIMQN